MLTMLASPSAEVAKDAAADANDARLRRLAPAQVGPNNRR